MQADTEIREYAFTIAAGQLWCLGYVTGEPVDTDNYYVIPYTGGDPTLVNLTNAWTVQTSTPEQVLAHGRDIQRTFALAIYAARKHVLQTQARYDESIKAFEEKKKNMVNTVAQEMKFMGDLKHDAS